MSKRFISYVDEFLSSKFKQTNKKVHSIKFQVQIKIKKRKIQKILNMRTAPDFNLTTVKGHINRLFAITVLLIGFTFNRATLYGFI